MWLCVFSTPNCNLEWKIRKSSTFEDLTDADLRRFQNLLNNRPRKNLNYKTPNEVLKNIILEKLH